MDITIIAKGSTPWQRFRKNWGLAFLIGENILFDTFSKAEILFSNMRKMDIDIKNIKHIVISHDHWDHTGGLWEILAQETGINVYSCPGFSNQFKTNVNARRGNLIESYDFKKISENIYVTGEIKSYYKDKEIYEQALMVDTNKGLSIITGCAHPGIMKIVEYAKEKFPNKQIYAVLGGFHLMHSSLNEIKTVADKFKELGVQKVGPTHCSGRHAEKIFRKIYKDKFINIKVRDLITL
ncbi:MAG: MBL fold metallo-hydrolase [Candidatus Omnitrophota bacterium]